MSANWNRISAITETIGAAAIVITLIYLAVQTQQNTAALLANTRNQIIDSDTAIVQWIIEHPAVELSMYQDEPPDPLALIQLENFLVGVVRTREYQWLQYRNGLLDRQTWESFLSAISVILSYPRTRAWWNAVAIEYFDDDFVAEINRHLENFPVIENYRSPIEGI